MTCVMRCRRPRRSRGTSASTCKSPGSVYAASPKEKRANADNINATDPKRANCDQGTSNAKIMVGVTIKQMLAGTALFSGSTSATKHRPWHLGRCRPKLDKYRARIRSDIGRRSTDLSVFLLNFVLCFFSSEKETLTKVLLLKNFLTVCASRFVEKRKISLWNS